MKHRFEIFYELDCTLACAVAAYLDAEHYVFLHNKYSPRYEVLEKEGRTIKIRQMWHYGHLRVGQLCTTEYVPPAQFKNYGIKGLPLWLPSVHQVMTTETELFYYPDETGKKTISHLVIDLTLPRVMAPLLPKIERDMTALKKEKDLEDMDMIFRRERLFGRGNVQGYLGDHQFMLHKDDFVEHFGSPEAEARAAEIALARAPASKRRRGVSELIV